MASANVRPPLPLPPFKVVARALRVAPASASPPPRAPRARAHRARHSCVRPGRSVSRLGFSLGLPSSTLASMLAKLQNAQAKAPEALTAAFIECNKALSLRNADKTTPTKTGDMRAVRVRGRRRRILRCTRRVRPPILKPSFTSAFAPNQQTAPSYH